MQWHDVPGYDPKPPWLKEKSDENGVIVAGGRRYFSDYDLQGVYELRDTAPPTYYRFYAGNWVVMDKADLEKPDSLAAKLVKREPTVRLTGPISIGTDELTQFVSALNAHVCGDGKPMFQHGAQDGFLLSGRPVLNASTGGSSPSSRMATCRGCPHKNNTRPSTSDGASVGRIKAD